jgi:hypothetical protein
VKQLGGEGNMTERYNVKSKERGTNHSESVAESRDLPGKYGELHEKIRKMLKRFWNNNKNSS